MYTTQQSVQLVSQRHNRFARKVAKKLPSVTLAFLKVGHLNARSLNMVQKFEEIASIILNEDFKIFALSETWLNSSIPSDLFRIPGYCPLFRLDRSDGRHAGGVGLYVSSEFVPKRRRDLESPELELKWVEI